MKRIPSEGVLLGTAWLEIALHRYFQQQGQTLPVILSEGTRLVWPQQGPANVVFLGGAPYCLPFHQGLFPHPAGFKLWVLCERHQNLLARLLNLTKTKIGILSCNELVSFPSQKEINFQQTVNFVYAGRLEKDKGIDGLADFIGRFRDFFSVPSSCRIFTSTREDHPHRQSLKQQFRRRGVPLHIERNDKWYQVSLDNPVYLSLSQCLTEDYAVSVCQARRQGWPTILSDWGGHVEYHGQNSYLLPVDTAADPCLLFLNDKSPGPRSAPELTSYAELSHACERMLRPLSAQWYQCLQEELRGQQ